jgi:hypothetical protein
MIRPRVHEKAPRTLRLVSALRASVAAVILLLCCDAATIAAESSFKVLALYSTNVEPDHVHFANDALDFFRALAAKNNTASSCPASPATFAVLPQRTQGHCRNEVGLKRRRFSGAT